MAPGKPKSGSPRKRRKPDKAKEDEFDALASIGEANSGGDSLCNPAVQPMLSNLVEKSKLSERHRSAVESALRRMKDDLDSLSTEPQEMSSSSEFAAELLSGRVGDRKWGASFRNPAAQVRTLTCTPPTRVAVVGSFLLGYASPCVADLAVEMPSSLFAQSKDYTNYMYHDKRLLYLTYLAKHLQKTCAQNWENVTIGETFLNEDPAKPLLCAQSRTVPYVRLQLIPCIAADTFNIEKLGPDRRNVREKGESSVVSTKANATIAYNDSILIDSLTEVHLRLMHEVVSKVRDFLSAVLLIKAWFVRRHLAHGGFIPAALLADIVRKRQVSENASGAHLFRAAVAAISEGRLGHLELGGVRVCSARDVGLLERCKDEARHALLAIDSKVATLDAWKGVLPSLFVTAKGGGQRGVPLCTVFDGYIIIGSGTQSPSGGTSKILSTLQHALLDTGRVYRIERILESLYGFCIKSMDEAERRVCICPEGIPEEEFKRFWGERVELRRFNDGKIRSAVVWAGGRQVLEEIVQYAFTRHIGAGVAANVVYSQIRDASNLQDDVGSCSRAIAATDELGKILRSIDDLPLKIIGVSGASPQLRYCGVQPARPNPYGKYIDPLDVVASFETSQAWPKDAGAIAASKAGFYVALKNSLATKGLSANATISFIDIFLSGFVFRLRLRVEHEKGLLQEKAAQRSLIWKTEACVTVHNMLRSSGGTAVGATAQLAKKWLSCHLLFSQLGNRPDEFVELLVARVFEGPHAQPPKSAFAGFCRFLHLLAEFPWETSPLVLSLAEQEELGKGAYSAHVGRKLAEGLDRRKLGEYEEAFQVFEQLENPRPAMGLVCPCEDKFSWFEKENCPEVVIRNRIVAAASASLRCIDDVLIGNASVSKLSTIFRTPKDVFDLALDLDTMYTPRSKKLRKGPMKKSKPVCTLDESLVSFDPAHMLRSILVKELGSMALFILDTFGGSTIFVKWRSKAMKRRPFDVFDVGCCDPVEETGELEPNRRAMVDEIMKLGHGLVVEARPIS